MKTSRISRCFQSPVTRSAIAFGVLAAIGIALTAQAPAVVAPLPPPPALNQVIAPDINKLGLLDCQGPATGSGIGQSTTLTTAGCAQYLGFPITNVGKRDLLVALGKAFYWDMRVGSDGVQACASCHFHAGADNRTVNQTSTALNRVNNTQAQLIAAQNPNQLTANPQTSFVSPGAVNQQLLAGHFPLAANPAAASKPNFGNPNVISSQGVHAGTFTSVDPASRADTGNYAGVDSGLPFNLSQVGPTSRRVPPRNTPTAIGAGFNYRNFWDGRANQFFNGVNPFGMLDPNARVKVYVNGQLADQQLMLPFSSLASQAVGPPGSDFEMSLGNRGMADIGKKLLRNVTYDIPLNGQRVSATDSVLASLRNTGANATGLNRSYASLIQEVFQPKFWNGPDVGNYTLMENNFSLFFGVAVQAYEQTLIPDQTPLDPILAFMTPLIQAGQTPTQALAAARAAETIANSTLSLQQRQAYIDALTLFLTPAAVAGATPGAGGCAGCHFGAEFTSASVSALRGFGRPVAAPPVAGAVPEVLRVIERMPLANGLLAVYDSGFYNIGVRPTSDDLSIFNRTGSGVPFSIGMLQQEILRGNPATAGVAQLLASGALKEPTAGVGFPANSVDLNPTAVTGFIVGCAPQNANGGNANGLVLGNACKPLDPNERLGIRGAFKTSTLRNSKFLGPYFHNGGRSSLNDVVGGHYNAGGIFNLTFNPDNCRLNNLGASQTKGCEVGQVDFGPGVVNLGLTAAQINQFVALMRDGLTDARVAKEKAPFDHPQLCVPLGHNAPGGSLMAELPEVGQGGNVNDLQTFEQALDPNDTGHEHKLVAGSCTMPAFGAAPNSVSVHP